MPVDVDRWSGDGQCGFCLQTYLLQLEVYCVECDRPLCPLCAMHRSPGGGLCPECANGAWAAED
jgi:hypothetical protein